jgi:hypothetical protein
MGLLSKLFGGKKGAGEGVPSGEDDRNPNYEQQLKKDFGLDYGKGGWAFEGGKIIGHMVDHFSKPDICLDVLKSVRAKEPFNQVCIVGGKMVVLVCNTKPEPTCFVSGLKEVNMNKFKIWQYIGILALILLPAMPVLAQFQQGTLISTDAKGISSKYDFKDKLKLGDMTVDYQQVGEYIIDGGSKILIASGQNGFGGLMQNFKYSQGKIKINERIIIGDLSIPREIIYEDGIPSIKVKSTKHIVKLGVYIDLNDLWLTLRQEKTMPELVSQMSSKDFDIRFEAVEVLATLGQPAIASMIIALKDSNAVIRARAAIALGKLGDARAISPLISALKDNTDENTWVRLRAAWALGQIKGTEQIVPLTQSLKKEENEFVRAAITKALKKKSTK